MPRCRGSSRARRASSSCPLRPNVPDRSDADVDVEAVVPSEGVEVALPVGDETDPKVVAPERIERRQRVLVEEEVLVPLPLTDHVDRAAADGVTLAPHAADDVLREADPDVLVVNELRVPLEAVERRMAGGLVERRVEREPVAGPYAPVALRPELGARPEQREVDVEENCRQHRPRIRSAHGWRARGART